jgi:hypothetical protein
LLCSGGSGLPCGVGGFLCFLLGGLLVSLSLSSGCLLVVLSLLSGLLSCLLSSFGLYLLLGLSLLGGGLLFS